MSYTPLDVTKPTTAQTRQAAIDAARTNVDALRDILCATGQVQGFNYSISTGTNAKPTQVLFKRGAEWIKVDLTYDGNDLVTKCAFYYSSNSGGAYDPMADLTNGYYVLTITYDGNFDVSATTWGLTP